MTSSSKDTFYYNKELKEKLLQNFGTNDVKEIHEIILNYLQNPDSSSLPIKDQILLEKLQMIREQRPLQLRKLTAQTEILEFRAKFQNHFQTPMSDDGSQILSKGIKSKYGFSTSQSADENIQLKKNFFIDRHNDGTYVGVCKVCQNFTTQICTTSREAELDIEHHLQVIHNKELYQK